MIIRPAQLTDLQSITDLTVQLFQKHQEIDPEYYQYVSDYTLKIYSWAEQQLASSSQFLIVAENDGSVKKIVGFISGYIKYLFPWFKFSSVGHISFLVIDPEYQKKGIGKELAEGAKKWFSSRDLNYIEVFTNEKNEAGLSAWKAYGYSPFNKFLRKKIPANGQSTPV